jgi:hypothetical protein
MTVPLKFENRVGLGPQHSPALGYFRFPFVRAQIPTVSREKPLLAIESIDSVLAFAIPAGTPN